MWRQRNGGSEVLVSRACLWRRLKSNARKLIRRGAALNEGARIGVRLGAMTRRTPGPSARFFADLGGTLAVESSSPREVPIPKGLCHLAQGCEDRATLGPRSGISSTPTGLHRFSPTCCCNPDGVELRSVRAP